MKINLAPPKSLAGLAGSKKAVTLMLFMLIVAFSAKLGLTQESLQMLSGVVMAYLGAQGLADFGKAAKGK